jgi:hypothetical protein
VPELADTVRLRDLIPRPRETGRLPTRRDQRRPPTGSPTASPPAVTEDSVNPNGETPHVDEYA